MPPLSATPEAAIASSLACWALLALCLTVLVSSSIDDAVSSSALAWRSVRADRSRLPVAISLEAVVMVSVPVRTCPTMPTRLSFMSLSACISWPVSSAELTRMSLLRSPAATVRATFTAAPIGTVIERVLNQPIRPPASIAAAVSASISVIACR